MSDNFKKRFGDPARVEVKFSKPSSFGNENADITKAYEAVLKGILKSDPTQDEIIGKKDIARHLKNGQT